MSFEGTQEELLISIDIGEVAARAIDAADEVAAPDTSKHLGRALEHTEQLPLSIDERTAVTDEIIKRHNVSDRALRRRKLFSGTSAEKVVQEALDRLAQHQIPTVTEPAELLQQYKAKRDNATDKRLRALVRAALRYDRSTPPPPPPPSAPRHGR
jgi:hypothetical protein